MYPHLHFWQSLSQLHGSDVIASAALLKGSYEYECGITSMSTKIGTMPRFIDMHMPIKVIRRQELSLEGNGVSYTSSPSLGAPAAWCLQLRYVHGRNRHP
jgi:hypothetical protein